MLIKVAVVEDHADFRDSLVQLLNETSGFRCIGSYRSCEELLEDIPRSMPHVVLMDIRLPGMSGTEGVRVLKSRFSGIDVIMLTVYDEEEKIFNSICAGASGYLLKKALPAQIIEAIKEIRRGGAPMTGSIARKVLSMFKQHPPPKLADYHLSDREKDILAGLIQGLSYKMIADQYFISIDTVRSHIKHIYEKLHVHSKSEAVARVLSSKPFL